MDILKGAKATVLYGSEGANGVVLITTKKGKKTRGLGVNINYEKSWHKPHSYINFQNEFGSGRSIYDSDTTTLNGQDVRDIQKDRFNFGPRFDNDPIMFLDSVMRPYQAYPNNYIDLFRTGVSDNVTAAISGANEHGNMRFAYTRDMYEGLWAEEYQNKNIISFNGKIKVSNFASFEVTSKLYNIKSHNRRPNIRSMVAWGINRDYPFSAIEDMYKNPDGSKFSSEGFGWPGQFAPSYLMDILWEQYENSDTDQKNHYIGSFRTTLHFTDYLYFVGSVGVDYTDVDYTTRNAITRFDPQLEGGKYSFARKRNVVQNYRAFLNFDKSFMDNRLNVNAFVGTDYKSQSYTNINVASYGNFNYPDFWNLDNPSGWPGSGDRDKVRGHNYGSKVLYAAIGSTTISWDNEFYLEIQGRNDWSSTLPPKNNSYFYPGVGFNWNFSNRFEIPYLQFGKLRMSFADVGIDAPGYYYAYNSYSTGVLNNTDATVVSTPTSLFAGDLKPERRREFEIGFDGRFFKQNRLGLSISYYIYNRYDQIMALDLSRTTGASNIKINAGHVINQGFEAELYGTPIVNNMLRWDLSLTGTIMGSKVKKLYPGITQKTISSIGSSVKEVGAEGKPMGEIMMFDYLTDGNGSRVVNSHGSDYILDKEKDLISVGNTKSNIFGGFTSNFSFKGLSLYAMIDYQFGASIFSYSNYYLLGMGINEESLKYRDEANGGLAYYVNGDGDRIPWQHSNAAPADSDNGIVYHDGVILPGVMNTGTVETPVYEKNTTIANAFEYYGTYIHDMSADFQSDKLYKNSYIKLRELSLRYTLPKKLVNKFKVEKLTLSVYARNPFFLYKSIPNIDPEGTLGTNSLTEYSFYPSIKTYGFGINVSF